MIMNEVELMRGLQEKSAAVGVSKGDLVALGTMLVLKAPTDKLRRVFENIEVRIRNAV